MEALRLVLRQFQPGQTTHVGLQRLGYKDSTIALLIILEQRHHRSANGKA